MVTVALFTRNPDVPGDRAGSYSVRALQISDLSRSLPLAWPAS